MFVWKNCKPNLFLNFRCEENLLFLSAVYNFKKIDSKDLLSAANLIVENFLLETSPYQINVSSKKTKILLEDLSHDIVSPLSFQEISFEVEWSIDGLIKQFKTENTCTTERNRERKRMPNSLNFVYSLNNIFRRLST
jgi:hypothetical protein